MVATLLHTKLRLDWAKAMWANLLREGPAHKTPRLVQHLRMLECRMTELEQELDSEAANPVESVQPACRELLAGWDPRGVSLSSVRLSD